jgi:hypothetical protein
MRAGKIIAAVVVCGVALGLGGCRGPEPMPSAQLEDYFGSYDDRRALAACLQGDGGRVEDCEKEIGAPTAADLTDADYDDAYEWYVQIAECLSAAAWPVSEIPTRHAFQAEYETSPWVPWSQVPPQELPLARETCPVLEPPAN